MTDSRRGILRIVAVLVVVTAVLVPLVLNAGCGETDEENYRDQWAETMKEFNKKDDQLGKQMSELIQKENLSDDELSRLIKLSKQSLENERSTFGRILKLEAPRKYWKLQAVTLYYLLSFAEGLQAQMEFYEAALSKKPTEDLRKIAEGYLQRKETLRQELILEIRSLDIDLGQKEKQPESSTPKPPSSTPQASSTSP